MTEQRTAWGWGLASIDAAGNTLDVWYPELTLGEAPAETSRPNHNFGAIAHDEADARGVRRMPVFTVSKLDEPIEDAADAYLRLHLLSMRLAKPNTLNLDGIFAKLNNVVWTNYGPFAVDDFALRKLDVMAATRQSGAVLAPHVDVNVLSIDKFPRMVDYVVPTGVRIGDADRVRLGAHLSEGTTVMHAGFVNFNAGTLGVSMVEGRVSQGVVVGNGSDIGGGASIMGTLSGGGKLKNSIGEHSLLGANAGIGISLGDNCVVEAGLYVTAGTKVTIYDKAKVAAAYKFMEYACHDAEGIKTRVDGGAFPADNDTLKSNDFLNMTSLTDSDGKAHEYFGGQKFNEELAKAAANVSTGYKFLPFEVYARGKFGDYAGDAYTGKTTLSDAVASWQKDLQDYAKQQGYQVK